MRTVSYLLAGMLAVATATVPAHAACTREDFARAVNEAGTALRKLNAESAPRLQARMRDMKTKMRWPEIGYEEKALQALHDERVAALDASANDLLARIDRLGTIDAKAAPDCSKLHELTAASLELQATIKAKSSYLHSKIDQMLGDVSTGPLAGKTSPPKGAEPRAAPPTHPVAPRVASAPPRQEAEPKAGRPAESSAWSPRTAGNDTSREILAAPPPSASFADEEGYTIDEIRAASAGFFGQVSANLGAVIEHLFRNSGRPTGYVLGTEGGGAILAGVRYGKGKLYMRNGATQDIYWHGPSLGTDVGAEGSKTLFLIYRLTSPDQLYASFTGIDGSAYLVGGVGATLVTNGTVVMAPIRSGIGLRLGANLGYIRFTSKATWNPF